MPGIDKGGQHYTVVVRFEGDDLDDLRDLAAHKEMYYGELIRWAVSQAWKRVAAAETPPSPAR